ncbi:MAG: hypothetical protein LUC47_09580, partial [Clostridiales bacterium]|nr:hypothetical protein [Clostridiales bacterium]
AAPASDSTVVNYYYIIKNSSYVKKVKSRLSYLTDVWVKTSKYNLEGTHSATSSLSVEATSGIFTLSKIKATGKYTTSFTKSISVEVTIEADSSKFSRLAFYQEKKKYKGDLYHVANSGISKVETKVGSGYSYVPSDIYIQVVYK